MSEKEYRDPDTLRRLYHGEGLDLAEVGDKLGCSGGCVLHWMDKHDIPRREPTHSIKHDLDIDEVERLYHEERLSAREIGEKMGCHKDTIIYRMEKHGIDRRDSHETQRTELDADKIWDHYWREGLTLSETAEQLGVTIPTLRRRMKEHGIPNWRRRFTAPSAETLRELYWEDEQTTHDIAHQFGVSPKVVERWFESEGVELRTKSERMALALRPEQPNFSTVHSYEEIYHTENGDSNIVFVHRLACVAWYGLEQVKDKVIHHKNNIPWDNREENLEPMDRAEHTRMHQLGDD